MKTNEIRPLTALRFIAALWVFAHHFIGFPYHTRADNIWQAIVIEGHIGVTLFFVLSGFLIALRYFAEPTQQRLNLSEFIVKRVARIFPLYYFVLFVTAFVDRNPFFSPEMLTHIFMVQGYFAVGIFTVVPTAWSIT